MSEGPSPKDKLAEALLRFESSSRRNYEVIPPAPSARLPISGPPPSSQDYYLSGGSSDGGSSTLGAPQLGGYTWATAGGVNRGGYSSVPQNTAGGVSKFEGDYYLTSSSSTFGSQLRGDESKEAQDPKSVARRLAERLARDLHLNRDFNKDYQILMEAVEQNRGDEDLSVLTALRLLTKEFLDTAQSVGSIIIDELFESHKTIPPVNIGGIAGGVKYVYRNILYKICLDTDLGDDHRGWMHGGNKPSHEKAMKTGAHELRGLMHYSSLRVYGLHFPLMLVMDYKGFRLVAEALLPINKETIRYGSSDGGETVNAQGDELCQMMRTVGQQLHLAPHIVKDKTLYGPGDQEVHLGLDNRYYCIDLARVFPCEPARHHMNPSASTSSTSSSAFGSLGRTGTLNANNKDSRSKSPGPTPVQDEPRSIFYKFFRPEFVLSYKKPLACDCFTAWGKHDPQFQQHNKDLIDAFSHLRSFIIPKYAQWLDKKLSTLPRGTDAREFWKKEKPLEELHAQGINIRHLGLVRSHCVNEYAKKLLLNEMIARVVKNLIRKRLRDEMHVQRRLSNEQVKDIVIEFYNFVLGKTGPPTPTTSPTIVLSSYPTADESIAHPQPLLRASGQLLNSSGPVFRLDRSNESISSASSSGSSSGVTTPLATSAGAAGTPTGAIQSSMPILIASSSPSLTGPFNSSSPRPFQLAGQHISKSPLTGAVGNSSSPISSAPGPTSLLPQLFTPTPTTSASSTPIGASVELSQVASSSESIQSPISFPDSEFLAQFYFQFETSLSRDEMKDPAKSISYNLERKLLFYRLNQMLGIEMNSEAEQELHSTTSYEFVHCDISSIAPRVRFMNLVDEAEGLVLYITAKQKKTDQRKRLLALATNKFQASCSSLPHNFNGYFYWGRSLYEEGKALLHDTRTRNLLLQEALSKLELVSKLRPGHALAWIIQVKIWLKLFETQEYQDKIAETNTDAEDFSFLSDKLSNAATRLMLLDIFWVEKLLRRTKVIFSQAQRHKGEPTSLLKIVQSLCLSIQTVSGPMLDAMPSVPLPPDAVQIKLPRLHVESLLLCARALLLRSHMASERASAAKPLQTSVGAHVMGINQDELHSKRLKFQIAEQFIAALGAKFADDAAFFDRLILDSLAEIFPLIKSSKNLAQAFQKRCREITKVQFNASTIIKNKSPSPAEPSSSNPNRSSGTFSPLASSSQSSLSAAVPTNTGSLEPFQIFVDFALPHVGPKLNTIDLSGCKSIPITVVNRLLLRSHLTLTSLDLSELPCITPTWLQTGLSQLTELRMLTLRELKMTDDTAVAVCAQLGNNLESLNVAGNVLTNLGLYRMSRELKRLEVLDLSGNNNLGALLPPNNVNKTDFADALANLRPSLTSLSMLECYSLTNQAVWDISMKLRHLKHLSIASKQISDQYLMKLEPLMPRLESLSLKALSNSDTAFKHLFSHLGSHCTYLSLRACMGMSDDSITALDKCTGLKTLHLGLCLLVRGHSLVSLSQSIHSITELDLSGLPMEPSAVVQVVSSQPQIRILNLASMESPLSDNLFISMIQNTPHLRELNMSSNAKITLRSIEALSKSAPRMESLSLPDCHGLTGIESPIQRLKMLSYLNIRYAHPKKYHCLVNPKFTHIGHLVTCHCSDTKALPKADETPNISKHLPELLAQHGLTKDKVAEVTSSLQLSDDLSSK